MKGFRNCLVALMAGMLTPLLIWVGALMAFRQRSRA
jgi:hypothetical protein